MPATDGDVRPPEDTSSTSSPFAVTRWTNLWFPVTRGSLKGDWFGGPLGPLFGPESGTSRCRATSPTRFKRGMAHTEYFNHPDRGDEGDAAWHIRETLALQTHSAVGVTPAGSRPGYGRFL